MLSEFDASPRAGLKKDLTDYKSLVKFSKEKMLESPITPSRAKLVNQVIKTSKQILDQGDIDHELDGFIETSPEEIVEDYEEFYSVDSPVQDNISTPLEDEITPAPAPTFEPASTDAAVEEPTSSQDDTSAPPIEAGPEPEYEAPPPDPEVYGARTRSFNYLDLVARMVLAIFNIF